MSHTDYDGWVEQESGTAGVEIVAGPADPPAGDDSAQLSVGTDGNSAAQLRLDDFNGTLLSDLTTLTYSTFVTQDGSGGQAPYIILNVDLDGNGTTDDQLFFEPVYQTGAYSGDPVPNQGDVAVGTWQTWDATAGGWWSLNAGTFGPPLVTLEQYLLANPGAKLAAPASGAGSIRVVAGFGAGAWDNFIGSVDSITIGIDGENTTFDFEANAAPVALGEAGSAGENETKSFDVLANDTDADLDELSLDSIGTVTVTSANGDVNAINADDAFSIVGGEIKFTPGDLFDALGAGETATVAVDYTISDTAGHTDSATLTLTVNGADDSTINGTNKADEIHGDQGPGGAGREDTIFGGNGNDRLFGEAGADNLWGENGEDALFGGDGDDHLLGGNGKDALDGGAGEDVLAGNQGNDTLTGGDDADLFVFAKAGGSDTVTDFDAGEGDLIDLDGITLASVSLVDADNTGPLDTVLQFSNGSATLLNTGDLGGVTEWGAFIV